MNPLLVAEQPAPHQRLGLGMLLLLCAVELPLAFRAGGYFPRSWMPVAILVAAVALVVVVSGPAPRLTRLQAALLGVFLFQAVWTIASLLWAGSRANAWEEADRTLLYLAAAVLVTVAVGWAVSRGLRWLMFGVLGAIGIVAAGVMVRLSGGGDILLAFSNGQLQYPINYTNGLAALLMMGFWLALGLGTGHARAWWHRAVLLAVAVMLVGLAVLPQSRGALWTFFIVLPWFVVLTPHRFRGLVNLGVVVGLTAMAWPALTEVWALGNEQRVQKVPGAVAEAAFRGAVQRALLAILLCGLAAFVISAALSAIESRLSPLDRRWVRGIGVVLVVLFLLGAGFGLFSLQRTKGDLTPYAHRAWNQFTSEQGGPRGSTSRFSMMGLSGRLGLWRVAARGFAERPLLGLGAQNYEFYFTEHRVNDRISRFAHSRPLDMLSDLGLPGAAAYIIFIVGTLIVGIRMRFRSRRPENQAATAAALLALGSWVVHSSADWLWQMGGVTWPAVLLLGGVLGAAGAGRRHGTPVAETHDAASDAHVARAAADDATPDARGTTTSHVSPILVRIAMAGAALILLVSSASYYVSLRYLDKTVDGDGSPASVVGATTWAGRLNPFSPEPLMMLAFAYEQAAAQARTSGDLGTSLTNLALAAGTWADAVEREPVAWDLHYFAGLAVLEYRDAAVAAGLLAPPGDGQDVPPVEATDTIGAPRGTGPATPSAFRQATWEELHGWAQGYLQEALRLNPRDKSVTEALARLGE